MRLTVLFFLIYYFELLKRRRRFYVFPLYLWLYLALSEPEDKFPVWVCQYKFFCMVQCVTWGEIHILLGYATRLSFKLLLNIEEFCNLVMLVSNPLLIIRSNEIDIVSVCVRACTRACMRARARACVCVCICGCVRLSFLHVKLAIEL